LLLRILPLRVLLLGVLPLRVLLLGVLSLRVLLLGVLLLRILPILTWRIVRWVRGWGSRPLLRTALTAEHEQQRRQHPEGAWSKLSKHHGRTKIRCTEVMSVTIAPPAGAVSPNSDRIAPLLALV